MLQVVFNELSVPQLAQMSENQSKDMVLNLIQVCKQLKLLDSTFKMRIDESFWKTQLDDLGTIRDYLEQSDELGDERYFLYAVTDSPYLPNEDTDIDSNKFLIEALYFDTNKQINSDSGLRTAYAFYPKPAPVISFATNEWIEKDFIKITSEGVSSFDLINIVTVEKLFEVHFEQIAIEYLENKKANPSSARVSDILPNQEITNEYLNYHQFYVERNDGRFLNPKNPIKTIKNIGNIVASVNGWIRNDKYSSINKREVFTHSKSKSIFITIDTEKGDFEIHNSDKNKNHLGAISFDGAKIEAPKGHKLKFDH